MERKLVAAITDWWLLTQVDVLLMRGSCFSGSAAMVLKPGQLVVDATQELQRLTFLPGSPSDKCTR